jgi:hypothetical protein
MKNINIDNLLYNLVNTRAYIMSEPLKNGLVLLANNTVSFLITKEEFARLNTQEPGSEISVAFKKLHFKEEQIQSTYIRYPVVNKVQTTYKDFLQNLFKIYTSQVYINSEPLHLSYNLSKTKDEYLIRVLGITGTIPISEVIDQLVIFVPLFWQQFDLEEYPFIKKYKECSEKEFEYALEEFETIVNPFFKAEVLQNYLKAYMLSLDFKLNVLIRSLNVNFELDVERETYKIRRTNRKAIRYIPKFKMPIEFNVSSLKEQLEEMEMETDFYDEIRILSRYEKIVKKFIKEERKLKIVETQESAKTLIKEESSSTKEEKKTNNKVYLQENQNTINKNRNFNIKKAPKMGKFKNNKENKS